jgi:Zn-dependent peptidase ImmA (M78 family)
MTMMVANQTHRDSGVARDDYVDVFAALQAVGVCCIAKPLQRLAGAYAAPEHGGPVVLLNADLDEMTVRHTAAHELGHHVFGHGSRADERVDPDGSSLGGLWPDEEKLAEAFAPWFLMPLPAVQTAMRRAGVNLPTAPVDIHQIACWLGATFAGTARHLVNLKLITPEQATRLVRTWRAKNATIRATLCGSPVPPPGRTWVVRPEADQANLHVIVGDTLVFPVEMLPLPLPQGLAMLRASEPVLDPLAAVVVTDALTRPADLTFQAADNPGQITVTLVPPPNRSGLASAWRPRDDRPEPDQETQ